MIERVYGTKLWKNKLRIKKLQKLECLLQPNLLSASVIELSFLA